MDIEVLDKMNKNKRIYRNVDISQSSAPEITDEKITMNVNVSFDDWITEYPRDAVLREIGNFGGLPE
jgi:hypothetical protein